MGASEESSERWEGPWPCGWACRMRPPADAEQSKGRKRGALSWLPPPRPLRPRLHLGLPSGEGLQNATGQVTGVGQHRCPVSAAT